MDPFVRDLMSLPVMGAAEERALARRARAGDAAARDALVTAGLRSVALRARMLGLRGEELRDAVQSGAVGLIRAVDRYDPDRGARLSTYAWRWIGAEMRQDPVRDQPLTDQESAVEDERAVDTDMLHGLSGVELTVIRLRFGVAVPGGVRLSRQAVADQLGLTISQVRTTEAKAMRQLRRRLARVVDRAPDHLGADPP